MYSKNTGLAHLAAIVSRPADQGKAHVCSEAGDVQHDAFLTGAEGLKKLLGDNGRAQDVDLKAGEPLLKVLLDKGAFIREVASVIDEDVRGAKGFEDGGDGRVVGDVGGVGFEGDGGELGAEGVLGLLDAGLVAAQDANALNTRGGETSGDMLTNTTTSASDKRTLASERATWKCGESAAYGLLWLVTNDAMAGSYF